MKASTIFVAVFLAVSPIGTAGAQSAAPDVKQDRPLEDPSESSPSNTPDPSRFGERRDEAFGAYQRGYYLTALELALPRARKGDPAAQTLVAEIHARGLGVPRDAEEAAKWYAEAAEQGVPAAQLQYALMLIDGRIVEQDRGKALALMRDAAQADEPLAQFNLAQMLVEDGEEQAAVTWYERAAAAGLPDAQYAMAQIYETGFGGREQNLAEARKWLERAASENYDTAQLDLGTWLIDGRGGEADPEKGFAWLKRAAESGNVAAQNRVAKLYRAGIGTEADHVLAAAWYLLARRAGLMDPLMEDFLLGLTEETIQEAEKRMEGLQ